MFRLLMPPTNGMETDFWARFPENLWFEYYPTGGDFFEEHSLTLPVRPLPELRGEKKAIHAVPDIQKGGKRSYGKETEGNQVPALTLCPVSVSRRLGVLPGNGCYSIGCPCAGRCTTSRKATPAYLFTREIRPMQPASYIPLVLAGRTGRISRAAVFSHSL